MNNTSVIEVPAKVKTAPRFVPAIAPADTRTAYQSSHDAGRRLFRLGKRLPHDANDAMRDGYKDAMDAGADAYYGEMMRDGAAKSVNWNSGAEVW